MKTNTPNPLVPQGTAPDKQGKSHVRIAVFTIMAIHAVLLGALLLQGCKRTTAGDMAASNVDTNYPPPPIDTSSPPPSPVGTAGADTTPPPALPTIPPQNPIVQTPPQNLTPAPTTHIDTPTAQPTQPAGAATEHVVVQHDTYSGIAKKYNTTIKALTDANPGVLPTRLKVGQKLAIPGPSPIAAGAANPSNGASSGQKTYVVKSGDNLMKIAKTTGTSLKALRAANNLKTDRITVGQKLVIPAKGATPAESGVGGTASAPQTLPAP